MLALIASLIVGGTLATAAAMKLAEPAGSRVALATYGVTGRATTPAWALLVAAELALATALLVGVALAAGDGTVAGRGVAATELVGVASVAAAPAADAGAGGVGAAAGVVAWSGILAAALFAAFAGGAVAALGAGRGGAPCGCMGGRGALGPATVVRAGGLALLALAAGAALLGDPPAALDPTTVPVWLALAGVVLAVVVAGIAALLLHRAPRGALDVADEGPAIGSRVPGLDAPGLLLFTSDGCGLCARVKRGVKGLPLTELEEERDAAAWHAAKVPGAPYAVLVGEDGTVLAKGAVNTGAQVRSLLRPGAIGQAADSPAEPAEASPSPAASVLPGSPLDGGSRRRFLARGAGATATLTAASSIGRLVRPGEAEAYHFCGHIYTTDSCPHPTGLPRIDAKGLPLRAADGHRVDDLGRLIDREGYAVGEDGRRLRGPDGRSLPRAPRTKVCTATARAYRQQMQVDGAWYRCCKGHVRKLVDCCTEGNRRINGDRALTGYCYQDRKVFCVMFFQTKVPC